MKIKITSSSKDLEYTGTNESGHKILLASNDGVSPMESILMASAACSSIDIELILAKMRQNLVNIEVDVKGIRAENENPKVFNEIHLHYKLYGRIKQNKAEIAVQKSVEKYCSVLTMLESNVNIKYTFEVLSIKE